MIWLISSCSAWTPPAGLPYRRVMWPPLKRPFSTQLNCCCRRTGARTASVSPGVATRTVGRAEIEVGEPAAEEAGHLRRDGMGIPEHDPGVRPAKALDFRGQCLMVGQPVVLPALVGLGRIRRVAPGRRVPCGRCPPGSGRWCRGPDRGSHPSADGSGLLPAGNGWPPGWSRRVPPGHTPAAGASRCRQAAGRPASWRLRVRGGCRFRHAASRR